MIVRAMSNDPEVDWEAERIKRARKATKNKSSSSKTLEQDKTQKKPVLSSSTAMKPRGGLLDVRKPGDRGVAKVYKVKPAKGTDSSFEEEDEGIVSDGRLLEDELEAIRKQKKSLGASERAAQRPKRLSMEATMKKTMATTLQAARGLIKARLPPPARR